MAGRRKTRGQIVDAAGEDDVVFVCDDGPVFTGDDDENIICGRCERTLLLGVAPRNAWFAVRRHFQLPDPHAGTAAAGRPYPVFVDCDCGSINRVWPIVPT